MKTSLLKYKVAYGKHLSEELACGNCGSIIYGYDEVICPVCAHFINMDDFKDVTEDEIDEIEKKYENRT